MPLLFICGVSSAQTSVLNSIELPSDPLAVTLGAMAAAPGAFSVENNVAATAFTFSPLSVGVSAVEWAPAASILKCGNFAAVSNLGHFALSLSARGAFQNSYDILDNNGRDMKASYTPYDSHFALGAAYRFGKHFSLGVLGRYSYSTIAPGFSGSTVNADASMAFNSKVFTAAMAVCNIGNPLRYSEESDGYWAPELFKFGMSFTLWKCLTIGGEYSWMLNSLSIMAGGGAKLDLGRHFFISGGYHYGARNSIFRNYASAGLGFRSGKFGLSGSYLTASSTLGDSFCVALTYTL